MYRILIFNDSKWRDSPSTAVVKYNLQTLSDNVDVRIVSYHIWKEAIELFNPHLVVLNHIQGKRNRMIASHVRRHGGIVVVQFNEGIIEFDGKAKIFEQQKGDPDVDLFLCWNQRTADLVGGDAIGCPRFDVYGFSDNYRNLIDNKGLFCDKYGLDEKKPIIVFGDSWPSAKFRYMLRDFNRNNWDDLKNTVADKWANADEFADSQFEYQQSFRLMIQNTAKEFPGAQIVIKTHPMSDYNNWSEFISLGLISADATLIHGEYIFNVLNAADIFVGKRGSITVAESWLLNTPAIKIIDDYDSASSLEQSALDTHNITTSSELVGEIDSLLSNELTLSQYNVSLAHEDYLEYWGIYPLDAAENTANRLLGLLNSAKPEMIGGYNLAGIEAAVLNHDIMYGTSKLDGFGNWDKAILQRDVRDMLWKIQ